MKRTVVLVLAIPLIVGCAARERSDSQYEIVSQLHAGLLELTEDLGEAAENDSDFLDFYNRALALSTLSGEAVENAEELSAAIGIFIKRQGEFFAAESGDYESILSAYLATLGAIQATREVFSDDEPPPVRQEPTPEDPDIAAVRERAEEAMREQLPPSPADGGE